ncbi:MAG: hypothetical protein IJR13_01980 [Bacteroidales bacterium]|nr:hypothetical protein [Bacteroidales bacterium]
MKQILSIALLVFTITLTIHAEERPGWVTKMPKAGNSSYMYVVERATGLTYQAALNSAIARVFQTTMMRIGTQVRWDEVNAALQNGDDWGRVAVEYNIPINKVCDYMESSRGGGYIVWVLCQVAKSGNMPANFDEFNACHDTRTYSDGLAALKSAIIPGLGQMGKRRYGTGIFTLLGEATLAGGAVVTYIKGKELLDEMKSEDMPGGLMVLKSDYEMYRKLNIGLTAAAATFYVYNIIRAATITPRYKQDKIRIETALIPTNESMGAGIGLTFNF